MQAPITLTGVRKRFGRTVALDGLDLEVAAGAVFGVVGPNGAGKTTTMRILLDLMRRDAGEVRVLGDDPHRAGPRLRARVGYLPGELVLDGRLTGRELLAHLSALSGRSDRRRTNALADRLAVDLGRPVRTLSKGNKQKVGIIQALQHEPELLILDEPTSGLDPLVQQTFHELIREAQGRGATVFLSSHVLSEVEQTADRVAVLRQGRIAAENTVDELRARATRTVRLALAAASAPADLATRLARAGLTAVESRADGDALRIRAELAGPPGPLIAALASLDVRELTIEEPDLEAVVLAMYGPTASDPDEEPADAR